MITFSSPTLTKSNCIGNCKNSKIESLCPTEVSSTLPSVIKSYELWLEQCVVITVIENIEFHTFSQEIAKKGEIAGMLSNITHCMNQLNNMLGRLENIESNHLVYFLRNRHKWRLGVGVHKY